MNLNFIVRKDGVDIECQDCHRWFFLPGITPEQVDRWRCGALIQDVLPQLSPGERELFISGECEDCFELIFAGCEDAEGDDAA